jgi:hypothetical protein
MRSDQELLQLLRQRAARPCPDWWREQAAGQLAAVMGDDGRWHLRGGEKWLCTWTSFVPADAVIVPHRQWCSWWTDGIRYVAGTPGDHDDGTGDSSTIDIEWTVALTAEEIDPADVPPRQRCRGSRWPAYRAAKSAVVQIRNRLIAEFGPDCAGRGTQAGTIVDHDHLTWLVRGLLCTSCNTYIDDCPHLAGCPWADYLAKPPATALALRYPRPDNVTMQRHRTKVAKLGYDPLAHLPEWQASSGTRTRAAAHRSENSLR